jgi:hypothetical protein
MITIDFADVYSIFFDKIEAYDFLELDDSVINQMLLSYLKSSFTNPFIRQLFSTLSVDEDSEVFSFEMKYVIDDSSDEEFVKEVLALGLCIKWLTPKINSVIGVNQTYGSKEEKFFSESSHKAELRNILNLWKKEQLKKIRDRGYIWNEYLDGDI